MEYEYIKSKLKYKKINEGMQYDEGDEYIENSVNNISTRPMYVLTFDYANDAQMTKMFEAIEDCLKSYGATSHRAGRGDSYIMPYFVNEKGEATSRNTGIIGGVGIPEDLISDFIKRFVELDGCEIEIGGEIVKDICPNNINEKIFELGDIDKENKDNIHEKELKSLCEKCDYEIETSDRKDGMSVIRDLNSKYIQSELNFASMKDVIEYEEGDKNIETSINNISDKPMYMLQFAYNSTEQENKISEAIENCLIAYGATSPRAQRGASYIMPYFVNEEGKATSKNTGVIGGVGIPEDLISDFIKRFIELDGCEIKIGDETIKDVCPDDIKGKILGLKQRPEGEQEIN